MGEPFMQWSEEFSCGIRAIDNDHRMLFEVLNNLDVAVRSNDPEHDVGGVIDLLKRYVVEHFAREERFMADSNYPDYAVHAREHRRIAEIVQAIGFAHEAAPETLDFEKILDFLSEWLMGHILGTDRKYIPYVKGEVGERDNGTGSAKPKALRKARTVQYTLPAHKADMLDVCARALESGDERARELEQVLRELAAHYPTDRLAAVARDFLKEGAELPTID